MGELENYRRIPSPVSGTLRLGFPVRQSRALDYIKTAKRFLLELLFNSDIDLAIFERFILNSPIRLAEYAVSKQDHSRIFMIDSRIPDGATQRDVWKWAEEELPRINASIAVECPSYLPATVRCLIELFPGGRVATIPPLLPFTIPGTNDAPAVNRILQGTVDFLNPYLQRCAGDTDFKEAMILRSGVRL